MGKHGKKYTAASEGIDKESVYSLSNALAKLSDVSFAKFDESVDAHVNVGIDPTKGDQIVRGSVLLPHGASKQARVVVFAKGDYADQASDAGADFVGAEDLAEKIKGGWLDFDFAVATPDLMGLVGQLAKILGPKGLLPNKKLGTVTFDVGSVVKELKLGRRFFKNDKSGIVHFSFGRVSFGDEKLKDNFQAFLKALVSSKPATSKGRFLKKLTITTTMGPGIPVNIEELV